MKIKVEINIAIISDENKYDVCDKIRSRFKKYLEDNLQSIVQDKSGEPLYTVSVMPITGGK